MMFHRILSTKWNKDQIKGLLENVACSQSTGPSVYFVNQNIIQKFFQIKTTSMKTGWKLKSLAIYYFYTLLYS